MDNPNQITCSRLSVLQHFFVDCAHKMSFCRRNMCWKNNAEVLWAFVEARTNNPVIGQDLFPFNFQLCMVTQLLHFPLPYKPDQLNCFVDAAHANHLHRSCSTTGYAFLLKFGVISYRSKTQFTRKLSFLLLSPLPSTLNTFVLFF